MGLGFDLLSIATCSLIFFFFPLVWPSGVYAFGDLPRKKVRSLGRAGREAGKRSREYLGPSVCQSSVSEITGTVTGHHRWAQGR